MIPKADCVGGCYLSIPLQSEKYVELMMTELVLYKVRRSLR